MHSDLPILRELGDDLSAAYARREARRPRLRVPLVTAAAVAAACVAAVAFFPSGDDSPLEDAAATAARQPSTIPPAGAVTVFEERGDVSQRAWRVAADGSGTVRQRMTIGNDHERPADDAGFPRWRPAGESWTRVIRFAPGEFEAVHRIVSSTVLGLDPATLPADPEALDAALREALRAAERDDDPETGFRGPVADWQVFTVVSQTLTHPLASPELRGALYEVAGGLEGVTLPRDGLIRLQRPGMTEEIEFDPGTSAILATATIYDDGLTDRRTYEAPVVRAAGG